MSILGKADGVRITYFDKGVEVTLLEQPFDEPQDVESEEVVQYINDLEKMFYECEKVKLRIKDEVVIIRNIDKVFGIYKVKLFSQLEK